MNGINGGEMPMPTQDYVMPTAVDTADQGMNSKWMVVARRTAGVAIVGGIAAVGAYFGIGGEAEPIGPADATSETTGHVCNTIVKQCETTSVPGDPEPTDPIKVTTTESTTTTTPESTTTTSSTPESSTTSSSSSTTTSSTPESSTTSSSTTPHETVPGVETTQVPTSELVTG